MTNLEKTALLKGRLAKIEQKNPTSGVGGFVSSMLDRDVYISDSITVVFDIK